MTALAEAAVACPIIRGRAAHLAAAIEKEGAWGNLLKLVEAVVAQAGHYYGTPILIGAEKEIGMLVALALGRSEGYDHPNPKVPFLQELERLLEKNRDLLTTISNSHRLLT